MAIGARGGNIRATSTVGLPSRFECTKVRCWRGKRDQDRRRGGADESNKEGVPVPDGWKQKD